MSLQLYMVGVIVKDMSAALEFYRRLGLAIPAGAEDKKHVEIPMGEITLFFSTEASAAQWDPAREPAHGGSRIILEFYLETEERVDAKYGELVTLGYRNHAAPHDVADQMRFAMINDPDGNSILLTGQLAHTRPNR